MNKSTIDLGEKLVRLCKPSHLPNTDVVGRENEMEDILAAWMGGHGCSPLSPLLIGEPGVGKTKVVYACAKACEKELYIINGHEDLRADDLLYSIVPDDEDKNKFHYIVSPLVTAMIRGQICFIDEFSKIRPMALAPLASLLEEGRYVQLGIIGEDVKAHPGFRFIAATNTADLKAGRLPSFIRSRMKINIQFENSSQEEIEHVINIRYRSLQKNGNNIFRDFWNLWREKFGDMPPTPRDTIQLFGYAMNLAHFESLANTQPIDLDKANKTVCLSKEHLKRALMRI